jgi:CRISP-associated protein Cas1
MRVDSTEALHRKRACKGCGQPIPESQRRSSFCSFCCYTAYRSAHVRPVLGADKPRRLEPILPPPIPPPAEAVEEDDLSWAARGAHWDHDATRLGKTEKVGRVLTLAGHGVSLKVERGALVVRSGLTYDPQTRTENRFYPTDRDKPSRLVFAHGNGAFSVAVLRWCERNEVSLILLGREGEVSVLTTARPAEAALIRAQVLLSELGRLTIARHLIVEKVQAASETISTLPQSPLTQEAKRVQSQAADVALAEPLDGMDDLRVWEARAARAYFGAWRAVPLRWAGTKRAPIPDSWFKVDARASVLTGSNRRASHPVNALLNYAYGVLEGSVRVAVATVGLDPTLGVMHSSQASRHALVYDLMEPLRPVVDGRVISFLMHETLHPSDFLLMDDGSVRLHPELCRRAALLGCVDATAGAENLAELLLAGKDLADVRRSKRDRA